MGLQVAGPLVDICCRRDATMPKRTIAGGGILSACRIPSLWWFGGNEAELCLGGKILRASE